MDFGLQVFLYVLAGILGLAVITVFAGTLYLSHREDKKIKMEKQIEEKLNDECEENALNNLDVKKLSSCNNEQNKESVKIQKLNQKNDDNENVL